MLVQNSPHTNFLMNDVTKQQAKQTAVTFMAANNIDTVSFTAKTEAKEQAETTEKKANKFVALLKAPFLLIAKCFTAIMNALGSLFKKEEAVTEPFEEKTLVEKYEPFIKDAPELAPELVDNLLGDIQVESNLNEVDMSIIATVRESFADDVKFFEFVKTAIDNKEEKATNGKAVLDAREVLAND